MTVAIRSPTYTTGTIAVIENGFCGPGFPEGTGGATTPKPVAKTTNVCPGTTGLDSLIVLPARSTAPKDPGSCATTVTFSGALTPIAFWTTRSTILTLGISKGTWTVSWVGVTETKGVGIPPMRTCVPPNWTGS